MEKKQEEIWKVIEEAPNYQVSNYGRVRNTKKKGKLIIGIFDKDGYPRVMLGTKDEEGKAKKITRYRHRLVAKAFIPNPENKPQVNHKDENIQNNNANNLEWCTHSYNKNYGKRNKKVQEKLGIKINQYDLKGNYIKTFNSITEAQKKCNTTHINECLSGKLKQTGGYIWKYAEILKGGKE